MTVSAPSVPVSPMPAAALHAFLLQDLTLSEEIRACQSSQTHPGARDALPPLASDSGPPRFLQLWIKGFCGLLLFLPPGFPSLPRDSAHRMTMTQDRKSRVVTLAPPTAPSATPDNVEADPEDRLSYW